MKATQGFLKLAPGYKPAVRRRGSAKEVVLHIQIAGFLCDHCLPYWAWWHTPNGGLMSPATGAKLKAMGVKAGVPDLLLIAPDNKIHFLEIKKLGGKLSPDQEEFRLECIRRGRPHAVVETLDQALAVLDDWGAIRVTL